MGRQDNSDKETKKSLFERSDPNLQSVVISLSRLWFCAKAWVLDVAKLFFFFFDRSSTLTMSWSHVFVRGMCIIHHHLLIFYFFLLLAPLLLLCSGYKV